MRDGTLVVDGVVHAYNWSESNWRIPLASTFSHGAYGFHYMLNKPDQYLLSAGEFVRDWSDEELEQVVFGESEVDVVAYHSTPLHDYYLDGLSPLSKGLALKKRNPERVVLYGNINPLEGNKALEEMEQQVTEYGVSGIKLYPARYHEGRTLPIQLDDPHFGVPVVERAVQLGVKSIAVHKAIPFGPTRSQPYHIDDMEEVAVRFPEIAFEVVHAGFAFLEETCFLLARFPNTYVNLEATSGLVLNNPRKFAEVMGYFLFYGGEDRIIFASGCTFAHPQPYIDALMEFQMPRDLVEGYGLPEMTDEVKHKILGANSCRMHDLDMEALKKSVTTDRWGAGAPDQPAAWQPIRATA